MRSVAIVGAAFAVMAALAGCAQSPFAQSPPAQSSPAPSAGGPAVNLVASGAALAQTQCAACHAIGAEGESPEPNAPPFRTLSQRYPVSALEEAFGEGVLTGHPAMPEFRFEPDELDALLSYIASVQPAKSPP